MTLPKLRHYNIFLFILLSVFLLSAMATIMPQRYGDAAEYLLMTEALFNHGTPDIRDTDIASYKQLKKKFPFNQGNVVDIDEGFYFSKAQKLYTCHFWMYSLFGVPVKWLLRLFHGNELKALQILNALIFIAAIGHIVFLARLSELQKLFFAALIVFSPAFWFLIWPHTEIFSASWVIMALVFMTRGSWPLSVFCSAMAATQNPQLVFLVILLLIKGVRDPQRRPHQNLVLLAAAALPLLLPHLFFAVSLQTGSYQIHECSLRHITFKKVAELFVDPNIGMLPYIPLSFFIFTGILLWDGFIRRKFTLNLQFFCVLLLMDMSSVTVWGINHGTSGPIRYVIWMLPVVFFVVINVPWLRSDDKRRGLRSLYAGILTLAVLVQGYIVRGNHWFLPDEDFLYHSWPAHVVMKHFPSLYNPTFEIFGERTAHYERWTPDDDTPLIYALDGKCRKALVRKRDLKKLEKICGPIPQKELNFFENKASSDKLTYINFPWDLKFQPFSGFK